ncbi:hypothetical protein GCM10029964_109970 [Kibdelosporangium lantanae]
MPASHEFSTPLLRVFVAVAKLGSFTAAGPDLGYTQSAISRQISALEDEVGVALFDRLPRGVRLTEPGRRLLPHAQAVLERLDTARRDLASLHALTTGRLRVAGFATADAVLVPQAIATFRRSYPDVEVTLQEGFTPDLLAMVGDGSVDIAVVSFPAGTTSTASTSTSSATTTCTWPSRATTGWPVPGTCGWRRSPTRSGSPAVPTWRTP